MEFTFELNYDRKAMTAMAKAIRVGLQEEQNKKSKIIGWVFVALTVLILLTSGKMGWMQIAGGVLVVLFALYLLFQDTVNGVLALWKLPEKLRKGQWLFRDDGYFSNTEMGESDYSYENIFAIVESVGYIFLVFHNGTAHILNVNTIQGGALPDFRRLLRRKTNLTIVEV
ncbi:MAG: YcxB family protein [Oscillospiraceae bacterium]|nr:YcxB family protein [Oscillospiraceae bacterium]